MQSGGNPTPVAARQSGPSYRGPQSTAKARQLTPRGGKAEPSCTGHPSKAAATTKTPWRQGNQSGNQTPVAARQSEPSCTGPPCRAAATKLPWRQGNPGPATVTQALQAERRRQSKPHSGKATKAPWRQGNQSPATQALNAERRRQPNPRGGKASRAQLDKPYLGHCCSELGALSGWRAVNRPLRRAYTLFSSVLREITMLTAGTI